MPRNSSGVYTLPAGNPVSPNTLIQSSWANTTLSDVANELTNSLDRNGRGSMLAPFKNIDGTQALPGITYGNEPSTGFWRKATAVIGVAIAANEVANFNAAGLSVTGVVNATGAINATSIISAGLGAVATPSHTFIGDLDTGFWSPGANQLAWSTNALQRLGLDNDGLFVGTKLATLVAANRGFFTVNGATNAIMGLGVAGAPVGYIFHDGTDLQFTNVAPTGKTLFVTNSTTKMTLDVAGSLGIGLAPVALAGIGPSVQIVANSAVTSGHVVVTTASKNGWLGLFSSADGSPTPAVIWNLTQALRFGAGTDIGAGGFVESFRMVPSATAPAFMIGTNTGFFSAAGRGNLSINGSTESIVALARGGVQEAYLYKAASGILQVMNAAAFDTELGANSATSLTLKSDGRVLYGPTGSNLEIGFRDLVDAGTTWVGTVARGKIIKITAGFTINTADAVPANSLITVFNNTTGNLTVTQGAGMSLFIAGSGGAAGNRTLLPRAMCSMWWFDTTNVVFSGAVS